MGAIACSTGVPTTISQRRQQVEYWVKKPASNDAGEVAVALLSVHFGLLPAEIEAFIQRRQFFISDRGVPGTPATKEQIQDWKRDALGRVPVTLSDYWIREIELFKEEYVAVETDTAAEAIDDPDVQALFAVYITGLVTTSGQERDESYAALRNLVLRKGARQDQILTALKRLEASPRYARSPYVALARATIEVDRAKKLAGPGYSETATASLREVARRLDAAEINDTTSSGLTRSDAARVSGETGRLFMELGQESEATRSDWLARFYSMSSQERARYREGSLVSLTPEGSRSITAVKSPTDQKIEALDRARAEQLSREIYPQGSPRNADRDNAFNRDNVFRQNGTVPNKNRGGGYQPKYKFGQTTTPLANAQREAQLKRGAGVVSLLLLVFKFGAAHRRMNELAAYMNKRDALLDQRRARNTRVFPPHPAKIRAALADVDREVARATDPTRKQQLTAAAAHLRSVLEESEAAWPGH